MGGWICPERDKMIWDGHLEAKLALTDVKVFDTATNTHTVTIKGGLIVSWDVTGG